MMQPILAASISAAALFVPASIKANQPALIGDTGRHPGTVVSAGGTVTDEVSALSLQLSHILRVSERTIVAAQLSGAKAESKFGVFSGGIAVRRLLADTKTFVGANVFFDSLHASSGFSYSQVGFGGEVGRGRFTLRGNYYLPVGDRRSVTTTRRTRDERTLQTGTAPDGRDFTAYGHKLVTDTFEERRDAMQGWDVELEMAVFEQPRFIDPVVAVGYYRTWDGGVDYSGMKARGEVRIGEHTTIGAEWREDAGDLGQEWRASVRFDFPIGSMPKPVMAANLPAVAAGDGKTIVPPGSGKEVVEVAPPERAEAALPRGFVDPVQRTPWPSVAVRKSVRSSDPKFTTPLVIFGPVPPLPDCDCDSGPVLIFP